MRTSLILALAGLAEEALAIQLACVWILAALVLVLVTVAAHRRSYDFAFIAAFVGCVAGWLVGLPATLFVESVAAPDPDVAAWLPEFCFAAWIVAAEACLAIGTLLAVLVLPVRKV